MTIRRPLRRRLLLYGLLAKLLFVSVLYFYSWQGQVHVEQLTDERYLTQCPNSSALVVTIVAGTGRLGNRVWEYLGVYALSRKLPNAWPAVPQQTLDTLRDVFTALRVPALEELAARCHASYLVHELATSSREGNLHLLQRALETSGTRQRPFLLIMPKFSIEPSTFEGAWPDLHRQLTFQPKLQAAAQTTLRNFRSNYSNASQVEFVGVHVRRTDYPTFIRVSFPNAKTPGRDFYLRAMKKMWKMVRPGRVLFVVASDDRAWCREKLRGLANVLISEGVSPEHDLALLAACNHTIQTYGSFGLAAALFSPAGHHIIYNSDKLHPAGFFGKKLGWTFMD